MVGVARGHCTTERPGVLSGKSIPKHHESIPYILSGKLYDDSGEPKRNTLKKKVDAFLRTKPIDHEVYEALIGKNMLANTVAVYGPSKGIGKLKGWIMKGNGGKVRMRLEELHRYHRSNMNKGWHVINGSLCRPQDMEFFEPGMFGDVVEFIDGVKKITEGNKESLKQNAEKVLFILLVSNWVALEKNRHVRRPEQLLRPFASTRQLAWLMGLEDVEGKGRRRAGTARAYLVEGEKAQSLGVFEITEHATEKRAPRLKLKPEWEHLMERVYEAFAVGERQRVGAEEAVAVAMGERVAAEDQEEDFGELNALDKELHEDTHVDSLTWNDLDALDHCFWPDDHQEIEQPSRRRGTNREPISSVFGLFEETVDELGEGVEVAGKEPCCDVDEVLELPDKHSPIDPEPPRREKEPVTAR